MSKSRHRGRWEDDEVESDSRHDKFTIRREQRVKQMLEDTYNPAAEEPVVERPRKGYPTPR